MRIIAETLFALIARQERLDLRVRIGAMRCIFRGFAPGLVILFVVGSGCQPKNPDFERAAREYDTTYEVVARVEGLVKIGEKVHRYSDAEWSEIEALSQSSSVYPRMSIIAGITAIDRTDRGQRERALAILSRLKEDSDPRVRRFATNGYARTQRIPEKGP